MVDFFMNYRSQISIFFVAYFPTIIFFLIILLTALVSFIRGIRKTRISIVHSLIAFTICLILFIALVEDKNVDMFLLKFANMIVGEGGMQRIFGVSQDCISFREIFIEFIPKQLNFMDGIALIAKDNGKYLSSLVDVSYRLVFGIVLYFVYWVLRFLLWIIYLIFYNERRYVRKREKKYENGLIDSPYRKKRVLSAVVGCGKGLVSALIVLSFLGMFFYIFAGGLGDKKNTEKLETNNEYVNMAYDAYSELESYGTHGIYKVLNAVRDEKNMPYYLFAANMIFQGKIEDGNTTTNVYLIDELATYVNFSKSTFNLFLKYDKANIVKLINNEEQINIMDNIVEVFKNSEFQREFEQLITQFEAKTYFVNLTLSLIDSLSSHLTDVGFTKGIPEEVLVPLRIMFERGYLCTEIPYENELQITKERNMNQTGYKEEDYILGYIKPSELLTRDDIFNIYKVFVSFLTNVYGNEVNADSILNALRDALPSIKNLSILHGDRALELDSVFRRIYSYLENKYLGGESEVVKLTSSAYDNGSYSSISWVEELSMLVDVLDSGMTIYTENFKDVNSDEILDKVLALFDSSNEANINKILNCLSSSRILGELFGTKFFIDQYNSLVTNLVDIASFPEGISFGNTYDSSGHFRDYGELYYVFKGLKAFMSNPDSKNLIIDLKNNNLNTNDAFELLSRISNIVSTSYQGLTIGDHIVNSRVINSILSAFLIKNKDISDKISIYIDDSILEKSSTGQTLNIIEKTELKLLFNNFPTFVEIAEPLINSQSFDQNELLNLVKDQRVINMLDSKIIEGTVSYLAANNVSGTIIIPKAMKDGVDLISTGSHTSEIRKLINVLTSVDIDLSALTNESIDEETRKALINLFKNLDEKSLDLVLSSNILYYTISNFLNENGDKVVGALQIIIPDIANEPLVDDTIDKVIKKEILREFIYDIRVIIPEDAVQTIELLSLIIRNKFVMDNLIISVTTANLISNGLSELGSLGEILGDIPEKYNSDNYGNKTKLKEEFSTTNPWYLEAKALINALNLVLVFDSSGNIDYEYIKDDIIDQIPTLNDKINNSNETKLDKLYDSEIFVHILSVNIDNMLSGNSMIKPEVLDQAKVYGTGNYKKSDIRALVNALKLFDISIDDNNIGDIIYEDVKSNLPHYTDKLPDYNNRSKLDLLYESSLIRALFTENITDVLTTNRIVEESSLELCLDSDGNFRQGEIESLIYLLNKLNIDDIDNVNTDRIIHDINNITTDDVDNLYRYYMTAILLFKVLNDSNQVYIASEARITKNSKVYEAINKDEAKALVYALGTLDVSIDDMELSDIDLDNLDVDIVSKSTIISSIFYKSIKNVSDIVIPSVVKVYSSDDTDRAYIRISEFKTFLTILIDNKVKIFGEGPVDFDNFDVDPSEIEPEVFIDMCRSKILSSSFAYKIASYLPGRSVTDIGSDPKNIMEKYKIAGTRDELEKIDNIWIENDEMRNLAYALHALGVTYDDLENNSDLSEVIDPTNLMDEYDSTNTKFDICYKSEIIQYLISDTIHSNITDELVEEKIKNYSYIYNDEKGTYTKAEIKGILDALKILEITNIENLSDEGLDLETFKEKVLASDDNKEALYSSYIIRGILTKNIHEQIYNAANGLYDCEACYEEMIHVYKKEEIDSLFDLIKDKDIENLDIEEDINLLDMLDLIYNENSTKSYIIVATATKNILASGVTIPIDDVDKSVKVYDSTNQDSYGIIKPEALRQFIESVSAFGISITGVNITIDEEIKMPTDISDDNLAKITASSILRATISKKLQINSKSVVVEIDNKYVKTTTDFNNNSNIAILSEHELQNIIKIVRTLSTSQEIGNISLSADTLMTRITDPQSTDKELLLDTSAIRVILGEQTMLAPLCQMLRTIDVTDASTDDNLVYVGTQS